MKEMKHASTYSEGVQYGLEVITAMSPCFTEYYETPT